MHQNNINKITCTKMTLVKPLLKTIHQMIIFLANIVKLIKLFATSNLSTCFDKFNRSFPLIT